MGICIFYNFSNFAGATGHILPLEDMDRISLHSQTMAADDLGMQEFTQNLCVHGFV